MYNDKIHPLVHRVGAIIKEHALIQAGDTVIVGFSGGPDSLFLLHALEQLAPTLQCVLIAAHLDHGWRSESNNDLLFCKNFCTSRNIRFIAADLHTFKPFIKKNGSKEDQGRRARRLFFEQILQREGAQRIALAHHNNDQQETFFLRLIRGTSLNGLCGIRIEQGSYIRPLLSFSKKSILDMLNEEQIPYLIDHSNNDPAYLRNRIRHTIIPAFSALDTRAEKKLITSMQQLNMAEEFIQQHVAYILNTIKKKQEYLLVPFKQLHPYLQKRVIIKLLCDAHAPFTPSEKLLQEIIRFLFQSKKRSHQLYQTSFIIKDAEHFSIKSTEE